MFFHKGRNVYKLCLILSVTQGDTRVTTLKSIVFLEVSYYFHSDNVAERSQDKSVPVPVLVLTPDSLFPSGSKLTRQ